MARKYKILTIDKLREGNHILNGYPICLKGEQSAHHLLTHCHFTFMVWIGIINLFYMIWVQIYLWQSFMEASVICFCLEALVGEE